jgi:cation diffusion facilitator family transporter
MAYLALPATRGLAGGIVRGHGDEHEHGHSHEDGRSHLYGQSHDDGHAHDHDHRGGWLAGALASVFLPHSHDAADSVDTALSSSADGIRALKVSLGGLAVTAAAEFGVVLLSGSVALLADSIHNVADALTAIPIGIAFLAGRRAANRRYTYGYGRSEDVAGLFVLLFMAASAVLACYEAIDRLIHPRTVRDLGWVAAAGVIGFIGNELVAAYRIRVGRRIGSAALVADGLHARTDGITSLAVVVGAGGVALGWQDADPVIGLVISVAILGVLWQAAREVFGRIMDRVDESVVTAGEQAISHVDGVASLDRLRMRWIGHNLFAEVEISADPALSLAQSHDVAEAVRHELLHKVRRLADATVHVSPSPDGQTDPHSQTAHHFARQETDAVLRRDPPALLR